MTSSDPEPPVKITTHRYGSHAHCSCGWKAAGRSAREASYRWADHWRTEHLTREAR